MEGRLTVFFEDPFWVGIFERIRGGKLSVCKVTFGAEPRDNELCEFLLSHYNELNFSPGVDTEVKKTPDNPKRRQREAGKLIEGSGVGTKAQQALQMQREEMKTERRQVTREQREAEAERKYELNQQKRKEKHKGH